MSHEYVKCNEKSFDKKYIEGWGNNYPDSIMISIYYNIIAKHIKKERPKVLDFGCSIGANARFFKNIGYDVYGIDISKAAIERCLEINNFDRNKFKALDILRGGGTEGNLILETYNNTKFDLIIASECLYYFSDTDLGKVMKLFNDILVDEGIIYGSWPTYNHPSYKEMVNKESIDGLKLVPKTGTMDEPLYVNIVNNFEELEKKFNLFETISLCRSCVEIQTVSEELYFIGRKMKE